MPFRSCRFIFLFILSFNVVSLHAQTAQDYYNQGIELKEQGKLDEAIEAFQKATGKDHSFAEAYHQLALCYLEKPNSNLERAMDAIINARRLDWDNKEYIYTVADINFEKNVLFDAFFWLNQILENDPHDLRALRRYAEYNMRQYQQWHFLGEEFKGRIIGNRPRIIRFRRGDNILESVKETYDLIIELYPEDRETLLNKGYLHYDEGDIDTFIMLLNRILDTNKNDKDALVYLGLAYSEKSDYNLALHYYESAFAQMSTKERAMYENTELVDALIDLDMFNNFKILSSTIEDSSRYWEKKNPFYITDVNERRLAHYGRVAEANLRFSVPRKGLAGWETARGLIWIKYGRPRSINRSGSGWNTTESWRYRGFSFDFFGGFYSRWKNDYPFYADNEAAKEKIEKDIADLHESYEYNPPGELFDFPVDVVNFRGKDDKTDVEIFFGVPVNKVGWESDEYGYYGDLQHGIFVHDNDWNRVVENVNTVFPEFDKAEIDTASAKLLIGSDRFEIEPGSYSLSVEVSTYNSGNAGITRDSLFVEQFGHDSLQMSDILIASLITLTDEQKPPSRDNITIIGEPRHTFLKNEPFHIYYEVYNLFTINEQSENRYKVEYGFRKVEPESLKEIELKNLIRNVPLKTLQADEVWVSSEISGIGKTDSNILQVDHRISDPGFYEFVLMITDMNSGMTATKSTPIIIY